MESRTVTMESSNKRPRSSVADFIPIASKVPKLHSNHLQINYLARQYSDNLPLVSTDDTIPAILRLIGDYDGVLHRHESIAGNLGACPLGPILIKRFERLFDGPPRVLKSHGNNKDSADATVTWLDVVEFAKNHPEQFNLEKSRNGVRVCQFYTKQCRVEISEEDFVLIASGMPQKMIPPQPIVEDEEKELGALEILEKNLQQITQMADQVSARARQLNYRLKNRRTAIISRRESEATLQLQRSGSTSPTWRDGRNGVGQVSLSGTSHSHPYSPPTGFVAVNGHEPAPVEQPAPEDNSLSSRFMFSHSNAENITIINGTSVKGASPTTRAELMKKFFTTADRQARSSEEAPPSGPTTVRQSPRPRARTSDRSEYSALPGSPGTVAIPSTPTSLLPPPKSGHSDKDDGGPFKSEMVARMEDLQRGERILPPCDRCRRLHIDCLKNLTACMGCTKKHAKCSWKDVKEEELHDEQQVPTVPTRVEGPSLRDDSVPAPGQSPGPGSDAALASTSTHMLATVSPSVQEYGRKRELEPERGPNNNSDNNNINMRSDSAPSVAPIHEARPAQNPTPSRRAMSEVQSGGTILNEDRWVSVNRNRNHSHDSNDNTRSAAPEDDDPDANQRLMQAIMDTVDHHSKASGTGKDREGGDRERRVVKA